MSSRGRGLFSRGGLGPWFQRCRVQEAYHEMLVKFREELTRPLQEAMEFMRRVESQLDSLSISSRSLRNILSSGIKKNRCIYKSVNLSVASCLLLFLGDFLNR